MPCLNEAETISTCVSKAREFLSRASVRGEVLIADNGSTDGSQALAQAAGARVVSVPTRGYGAALTAGIKAAHGKYVIMGDADDSYDFSSLDQMLEKLRGGHELVMGNRFRGSISPGAMPPLHRYLGNPVLSFLGRLFYRVPIGDFHCGLRGFSVQAITHLDLSTPGMEFASEMVVKSALHKLKIAEVPVTLSPDGRSRPPHLRTWRDGWRHLRFLLLYSPRWLFLLPGLSLLVLGVVTMAAIASRPIILGSFGLDIHTMAYAGAAIILGSQMTLFAIFTKLVGMQNGWLPEHSLHQKWISRLNLETCLVAAVTTFTIGLLMTLQALALWSEANFGALDSRVTMRWVVPGVTALALGGELFLAGFFIEALRIARRPPLEK
ncbi:glycosyltransferase family 2 protein [Luteimonas dalianensis]